MHMFVTKLKDDFGKPGSTVACISKYVLDGFLAGEEYQTKLLKEILRELEENY